MQFFTSINDIRKRPELLAYVRVLERAWEEFGLSGVLCVDNIPVLYQKDVRHPLPPAELNSLHRRFWNQGIAKVLVVADSKTVRIFSGLAKPQNETAPIENAPALVQTLSHLEFTQQRLSICQAIENGTYYAREKNAEKFHADGGVDRYLLGNLVALRNRLITGDSKLPSRVAHSLIGRVLFVCYLIDRGIISIPEDNSATLYEAMNMRSVEKAKIFLYNLFDHLKVTFNGSMFDQNIDDERILVRPSHLDALRMFLGGHQVATSQWTLGFWAYDFKLIPVETISAIYEEFLTEENPEAKGKNGAFYTPRFLAEMTLDVALENRVDWASLRYLDPCCGSGVFLVTLFNRLATRWLLDHPEANYRDKADALLQIIKEQIRGVDINEMACSLTCFSLYISLLDALSPSDIQTYVIETKNKLPRLLKRAEEKKSNKNFIPVVLCDDFLKTHGLPEVHYDMAIGNPPWEGRGKKQVALHVLNHLDNYLGENGSGCLLLPSKLFLNSKTNSFQKKWLRKHQLHQVIQLADFRFVLFEHAKCPSMIVKYSQGRTSDDRRPVLYDTPKFNLTMRQRGLITITATDRKFISYDNLIQAADNDTAPQLWKRWLWGTQRDQRLLGFLSTLPTLGHHVDVLSELRKRKAKQKKRWVTGQGFKPYDESESVESADRELARNPWDLNTLFVSPKDLNESLFLLPESLSILGKHLSATRKRNDLLYSSPPEQLFKHPMVLVSQGFGKVVFSDFNVLFQDSLQSISGPSNDEEFLYFLTAFLRSNLARYTAFHTAANWGTERDKVHLEELLRLPFPLPEDAPAKNAAEIISAVAKRMRQEKNMLEKILAEFRTCNRNTVELSNDMTTSWEWQNIRKKRTADLQTELEPMIFRYFGLLEPEIALINDTINISIPSSTPSDPDDLSIPSLQPVMNPKGVPGYDRGLAVYAETLVDTLNVWASERKSDFRVSASGGADPESGLALLTLKLGKKDLPFSERSFSGKLAEQFAKGYEACARETNTLRHERELLWFDGDKIHILRPAVLMHWTRTAALNDADHIYGEIALARRQSHA